MKKRSDPFGDSVSGRLAMLAVLVVLVSTLWVAGVQAQSLPLPAPNEIATWVEELGSPVFQVREAATSQLIRAGEEAIPALLAAADDEDKERARRARIVLAPQLRTKELKELKGTWKYVSIKLSGEDEAVGGELVIGDGAMIMRKVDGTEPFGEMKFTVKVMENPKHLDFVFCTASFKKSGRKQSLIRCLYLLEGDTLTLCYSGTSNGARPEQIQSQYGDGLRLHVLKRVEPALVDELDEK